MYRDEAFKDEVFKNEVFKDFPGLHQISIDTHLLDLIPGGFSVANDASCQTIIHNSVAAKLLRVEQGDYVKVYQHNRLLKPEEMPLQRAVCYGKEIDGCELEFVWEDGLARVLRWSARPLRDHNGQICGAIATVEEITDLMNLTQEFNWHKIHLQESYCNVFNAGPDMMTIMREADHTYVDVNDRYLTTMGLKREEVIGKTYCDLGIIEETHHRVWAELIKLGELHDYEIEYKDDLTLLLSGVPIILNGEKCFLFSYKDITTLKNVRNELANVNQQLAKSNQFNTSILESIQDTFVALDSEWNYTYVNSNHERRTHKTKQELIGKNVWTTFPQVVGSLLQSKLFQAVREKTVTKFEYISFLDETWYECHVYPSQDGVTVLSHDITSRKEAEKTKTQLASLVENSEFGRISLDLDGTIVTYNYGCERIYGYTEAELIDKHISTLAPSNKVSEVNRLMTAIHANGSDQLETICQCKDDRLINVLLTASLIKDKQGTPFGIECILMDLTERKHMEREMARLDCLNLIGELAAGISHEVRNPMTVVRGYLQLFTLKPQFSKFSDQLNTMIDELDRANSIITEFLSIGRKSDEPRRKRKHNLNFIIESLLPLIEADALGQEKEVKVQLEEITDLILNEKEIRQVVLNLVRNGLEVMQAGKTLTIKTYVQGQHVILAVQDQGPGIPAEVYEKIGTPFFSTKEGGTGLGLAVCYGIASRHNATIMIDTGDSGTTFFVRFNKD